MDRVIRQIILPCLLATFAQFCAAADFRVIAFPGNGTITWEDANTNGHYSIEWASTLNGPWQSDWFSQTQVPATGGNISAQIPMFFRVVHRPLQSQSADMVLVSGGGQLQGPQYDFYMSKYETTEEQFCAFLNDAQANPGNERGANMWYDVNGDAYIHSNKTIMVFDISRSDFIYFKTNTPGTRYAIFYDSANNPVTGVSWYGAVKYCNWLTIREGRGLSQRCYSEGANTTNWHPANLTYALWADGFDNSERIEWVQGWGGFRLPMSNYSTGSSYFYEFYKAAAWNGVSNTAYAFGRNTIDGKDANYSGSGDPYGGFAIPTTPVGYFDGTDHGGTFQTRSNANHYGIFDLSGNVQEWSTDASSSGGTDRQVNGGSWQVGSSSVFGADRSSAGSSDCSITIGFRVCSSQP